MPSASMPARTRSGWPMAATPGSVTSRARVTPRRLSSQPASAAAPGPYLMGVASSVKIDSCSRTAVMGLSCGAVVGPAGLPEGSVRHVTDTLTAALSDAVGERHVLLDDDVRAPFEVDWTGRYSGVARAVVRPADARQGAALLAACREHGAPVG